MNKSWNACEINKQRLHTPIKHCARCHTNPTVEQHGKHNSVWNIICDTCHSYVSTTSNLDTVIHLWNACQ